MLIDTHCHLNLGDHFPDPAATLAEAAAVGVDRVIVVGIDRPSNERALELADRFPGVYAVVGYHPNSAAEYTSADLMVLEAMLRHPKAVALGEIGLDYHWDFATPVQQQVCLNEQLDLAAALDVPVVFHCRKAYPELLGTLEARPVRPYLLHCFSGTVEDGERALALGAVLGFDGPITYKNAKETREVARRCPPDRLVVETDCPYLPPEPHRGKPNRPAWVAIVNAALASVRGLTPEACASLTTANAERFFRLPAVAG